MESVAVIPLMMVAGLAMWTTLGRDVSSSADSGGIWSDPLKYIPSLAPQSSPNPSVVHHAKRVVQTPPQPEQSLRVRWVREEACRSTLEGLLGHAFPSTRKVIKSPLSRRYLELDGYCAALSLAFEHNGKQHYEYPNRYHRDVKEFARQCTNDHIKHRACRAKGITLIVVRYDEDVVVAIRRQLAATRGPWTPLLTATE